MKTLFFTAVLTLLPNFITAAEAATLIQGAPNAAVQITIYGDIQCPFTAKLMTYLPLLETDFGDRVAVSFSHFPLSFHSEAKTAAIAADCAGDQFRAYLTEEFAHQTSLGTSWFIGQATKLGMEETSFKACLANPASAAAVDAAAKFGSARGVDSTPTFTIGEEVIRGAYPYPEIKEKIEKLLRR